MRVIKFKFEHLGELFLVEEIDFIKNKVFVNNGDIFNFEYGDLIQFTGLKDKNGVEIYEGDIVEYFEEVKYKIVKKIGFIKYEETRGVYLCKTNKDLLEYWNELYMLKNKRMVIVGNIYENKELLEK